MSYEGFLVKVCENGHYDAIDAYNDDRNVCPICGSPYVHRGSVDETNGLPYYVQFELRQKSPEKYIVISGRHGKRRFTSQVTIAEPTFEFIELDHWIELPDGDFITNHMKPMDVTEEE